jgi:acetyl-CoA carboxylase biotin carboxyl carrier protein
MKLFNEIESDIAGKVVEILADDASPVEYDQPLFLIDPKG